MRAEVNMLTALLLGLVGGIAAVIFAVALPASRDAASGVFTTELVHAACHLGYRWEQVEAALTNQIKCVAVESHRFTQLDILQIFTSCGDEL